ncbi:MAG TPA: hypothetical protein VL125_13205 [Pelobium sp.]|nr:hypothetical protein [Pelobium sp.]
MIYDSGIWKEELKDKILSFKSILDNVDFSLDWYNDDVEDEKGSYWFFIEFQKFCFYSAVIVRKFIESNRLSIEFTSTNYKVLYFKRKTDKILTKYNFHSVDDEYDTDNEFYRQLTLRKICDLFIHSFIFNPKLIDSIIDPDMPENHEDFLENFEIEGISGLYINTDYSKESEIYFFTIDEIISFFEDACSDRVIATYTNNITGVTVNSRNPNYKIK